MIGKIAKDVHLTSATLPRNWQDSSGRPLAKDYEPGTGKPRFSSIHEVNEAVARHNGENESCDVSYGELPLPEGQE